MVDSHCISFCTLRLGFELLLPWSMMSVPMFSITSLCLIERAALMQRHSRVYSSMMFRNLICLPSSVVSNMKSKLQT